MKLVRFDRSILDNIGQFRDTFPEDHVMILHALIYVAYDVQYSVCDETLFGAKIWDPYKMADSLKFSPKSLVNKTPEHLRKELADIPVGERKAYIEERIKSGIPLWDTHLDNALYILMEQSRLQPYTINEPNFKASGLKRLHIFDGILKLRSRPSKKIVYEINYSKAYVTNLANFFSKFDLDLLIQLPLASRLLYLSIMNQRDITAFMKKQHEVVTITPPINLLFMWANVNQKKQAENMRELKKKLKDINTVAHQLLNRRPEDPPYIEYELNFDAPRLTIRYTEEEIRLKEIDTRERFNQFLFFNLKEKFREINPKRLTKFKSTQEFASELTTWLECWSASHEEKMNALRDTYLMVYGNDKHFETNSWKESKELIPQIANMVKADYFIIHEYAKY